MAHTDDAIGDCILLEKEICRRAPLYHEAGDINSISAKFEAAMADAGLEVPLGGVKADAKVHRCDAEGEGGKGEGAYQLDLDGIPAGWFQNNRDGASPRRWHARTGRTLTATEIATYKAKARLQRASRDAFLAQQQEQTAKRAAALIHGSEDAPASHRHLNRKNVQAHGLRYSAQPVAISPWRDSAADVLIVPLRDIDGTLWNAQLIDASGATDFLKDGRVKGCFYVIGKSAASGLNPTGLNLICEEFATAATCFEAMDVPAAVAFDGGNLPTVAKALHAAHPRAKFIVCGNDNWKAQDPNGKPINPGRTHAMNAARAIGAEVAFPVFNPGRHRHDSWTDFNDLHCAEGLGAVRAAIEAAEAVEKREEREARPINADLVEKIEAAILSLAALSEFAYETVRKDEAKALKIDVRFLDKKVKEARKASTPAGAGPSAEEVEKPAAISTLEPWPEAVDGQELAGELTAAFKRHVIMTNDEALAAALWCLHSHAIDAATISPILMIKSPEKKCGKTTAMKMLKWLAAESLMASNLTASSVYRVIDQWHPSLIIDEADSFLKTSDELKNVLNSGHDREGAYVIRTAQTSKGFEVKTFSTWSAKAMALIGTAPDTLEDRSITIKLRRKLTSEKIVTLRGQAQNIKNLGRKAARWLADHREELRGHDARVPSQITNDRAADNWRTLLSIADQLGGKWPARARAAALAIEGVEDEPDAGQTPGVRLLADCKTVFENRTAEALSARDLIDEICSLEESRLGKRITESGFAAILKPFGIKSKRETSGEAKGKKKWHRTDFEDPWRRYLS